jgi:hypothetical protein
MAVYTLSVPWNLKSLTSSTTSNYSSYTTYWGGTSYGCICGGEVSPDGKSFYVFTGSYGNPNCSGTSSWNINYGTFGTAWTFTTWVMTNSGANYSCVSATGILPSVPSVFNPTGTQISALSNVGPSQISVQRNFVCDFFTKYNYNISSYSLSATPTQAYYGAPTVNIDAETTASRVNMFNYDLYLSGSASTTQATVYLPATGVIATGDSLLLNGTTSVTTSAVTQTTGISAVPIYTAANRYFTNKTLATTISNTMYGLRISTDGSKIIINANGSGGPYGPGLYSYTLTTPFDISTGIFSAYLPCTYYDIGGFDISPDGTRMIMGAMTAASGLTTSGGTIYEYTLSQPWAIQTAVYNGTSFTNPTNSPRYTSIRYNANGTQIIYAVNDGSTYGIYWVNLGTPYRLTGASGGGTYVSGASSSQFYGAFQTSDGLNIITISAGNVTTSNTLSTAYNMSFASVANAPTSTTNKWTWPTGTVTSTSQVYGMDISADGTKMYITNGVSGSLSNIYEMGVMVIPQTSYLCTYPTQGSAPTSVTLPDRSTAQSITTTLSGGVMTFSAPTVSTNARGIALKTTSPKINTTITNATINLWHN